MLGIFEEKSILSGFKDAVFFPKPHDRSILSLSVHNSGNIVVTASSDHGLRVYDLNNSSFITELYGREGHSDWVTTCEFLPNGKIVSGSMDGSIKLWNSEHLIAKNKIGEKNDERKKIVRSCGSKNKISCTSSFAHKASVSCLKVCPITYLGITGGYDGCMQLWNFKKCVSVCVLKCHRSPILNFVWKNSFVCSGDRNGSICIWDINKCNCIYKLKGAHEGGVGDIALLEDKENMFETIDNTTSAASSSLLLTGGRNDGCLCVYDNRIINKPIMKKHAHSGAINKILCLNCTSNPIICTLSADKTCKYFDIRKISNSSSIHKNTNEIAFAKLSDVIMCGTALNNNIVCCGCGDGNVYAISLDNNGKKEFIDQENAGGNKNKKIENPTENATKILWGYGANKKGAIHDMKIVSAAHIKENTRTDKNYTNKNFSINGIVTGGDDGILCYLRFSF